MSVRRRAANGATAPAAVPGGRLAGAWPPLLFLLAWQVAAALAPAAFLVAPPPLEIVRCFPRLLETGLLVDVGRTLARLGAGVAFGGALGLLVGYGIGLSSRLRRHLEPTISLLHPTPKVAIFPLLLLLLGVGEAPRLALIAFGAFFPVVINVSVGVRQVPTEWLEVARIYGASRGQQLRHVVWPASLPWLLTGTRIALSTGFVATLTTELLASHDGLGHRIWQAWELFRPEQLYAVLAIIATLGFLTHRAILAIAERGLRWRPLPQRFL